MLLNSPLTLIPLTTSPFLILGGLIMLKWPPKTINSLYGYKSARSMKNQANWDFSQFYAAKKLVVWGIIYLLTSVLGLYLEPGPLISAAFSIGLLLGCITVMLVQVEKALKTFEHENI